MRFDEILQGVTGDENRLVARVPEDWSQGRSTLGGLIAALAVRALRQPGEQRPLRSLLVSFVGPVGPGEVAIEVSPLRSGRSLSHLEARLVQDGTLRSVVIGALGVDRDSQVSASPPARPQVKPPDEYAELPYVDGIYPAFTQHFAYRWTHGALPFSGQPGDEIAGWCRFRKASGATTMEHVVAMLDAWPAPVLGQLSRPAPASSVTWGVDLAQTSFDASPADWWFYRSVADAAGGGYIQAQAALWDPAGRLAALGRQTIAVFD